MNLVRLGDTTTGGGVVITASETMNYDGRKVARKGDLVTCTLHPEIQPNFIIEGDSAVTDGGIPIARHMHQVTCGCRLIASAV